MRVAKDEPAARIVSLDKEAWRLELPSPANLEA